MIMVYFFIVVLSLIYLNINLQFTYSSDENKLVVNLILFNNFLVFKLFVFIEKDKIYYKLNSGNINLLKGKNINKKDKKKEKSKKKKTGFIIPKIVIDKFSIDLIYGDLNNAASTALICGILENIFNIAEFTSKKFFKFKNFSKHIKSDFNHETLKINLSIQVKKLTVSIIIIFLRILFLNIFKRGE